MGVPGDVALNNRTTRTPRPVPSPVLQFEKVFPTRALRRRTVWRWAAGAAVALLAMLIVAAVAFVPGVDRIRRGVERTLADRFDADVSLKDLRVSLLPGPRIEGAGLTLTRRRRPGDPPLLVVSRFTAAASWRDVFRRPWRVGDVRLEGLRVTISPKPEATGIRAAERGGCLGERRTADAARGRLVASSPVLIERLTAPATELELLPRDPNKQPQRFSIKSLLVRNITLDEPLDFDAVLTNPVPKGLIEARGRFGPWVTRDPGLSAVDGTYVFDDVDLGTIEGIGGSLTSAGRFTGVLQQILVSGTTDTPDFSLDTATRPLPLHTDFDACVDGTDGDTYLDAVRARLASSPIEVRGKVEGQVGVHGRAISLDATVDAGRIEDFLQLAVKGDPSVMTGQVRLRTAILIPPGPGSVVERLQMKGQFGVARTRFPGPGVQGKVDEFSRRGRGRPGDARVRNVASDLSGRFALGGGTLRLDGLAFVVPGARVRLSGTYGLVSEQIAFAGAVRFDAKVSEMTTGLRSTLLRAVDPLFSRPDAGTVVPITISGTRERPKYGVDVRGALTRKVK
jgi:hypothetical protein